MTFNTTSTKITVAGNGSTTEFNFSFIAVSADDLIVELTNSYGDTSILNPSVYDITLNDPPVGGLWSIGGTLTYPLFGFPLASGNSLTIIRNVPYVQDVSVRNQGAFYPQAIERGLDILEAQIQQLRTERDYAIKAPLSDPDPPDDLPSYLARANKFMGFDGQGNPIAVSDPVVFEALSLPTITNITGLKNFAVDNTYLNTVVCVAGYYLVDDGGGGFFRVTNVNPGADDGGLIIHSNTSGFYFIRMTSPGTSYNVLWWGARGDGVSDNSDIFNYFGTIGGRFYIPSGSYNFNSSITCLIPGAFYGSLGAQFSNPAVQLNFLAADSDDRIVLGNGVTQTWGFEFHDMRIVAPNATGGSIFFLNFAAQCKFDRIRMQVLGGTENGFKMWKTNSTWVTDVRVELPNRAFAYIYGDTGERTDSVDFLRCACSGNAGGAADILPSFLELNGFVNTINGRNNLAIQCGRGIWRHNQIGSTDRGDFDYHFDLEVDFPYYEALRYESGSGGWFVECYFHGSVTEHGIVLISDTNGTTLPICDFQFIGCKVSGHWKNGMYLGVDTIRVIGCRVDHNGLQSPGAWSGIAIVAGSSNVVIDSCRIGAIDNAETQLYAVLVDNTGSPDATNYYIMDSNIFDSPFSSLKILDTVGNSGGFGLRSFGAATWNPGSVVSGSQTSTTVGCTGAVVGDKVEPKAVGASLGGLMMWGDVLTADVATVYLSNSTGAPVDLPSMTLTVVVRIR